MPKPLKVTLKDHHADNERLPAIRAIAVEYNIPLKEAKLLIDSYWSNEDFADKVIAYLDYNYKRTIYIKYTYAREEVIELLKLYDPDCPSAVDEFIREYVK